MCDFDDDTSDTSYPSPSMLPIALPPNHAVVSGRNARSEK
jgi:hypothetical protein